MDSNKEWAIVEQMMSGQYTTDGVDYIRCKDKAHLQSLLRDYRFKGWQLVTNTPEFIELEHPRYPGIIQIETYAHAKRGGRVKDASALESMKELSRQFTEAKIAAKNAGAMELEFDFGDGNKKHLYWDGGNWSERPNSMELKYNKNRGGIYKAKFDPSKVK